MTTDPDITGLSPGTSLLLCNLSEAHYRLFEAEHPFLYSGSTGDVSIPLAPYVATFFSEIPAIMRAFGWNHVTIEYELPQGWTMKGQYRHSEG